MRFLECGGVARERDYVEWNFRVVWVFARCLRGVCEVFPRCLRGVCEVFPWIFGAFGARFCDLPARLMELPARLHNLPARSPQIPARSPELPAAASFRPIYQRRSILPTQSPLQHKKTSTYMRKHNASPYIMKVFGNYLIPNNVLILEKNPFSSSIVVSGTDSPSILRAMLR